MRARQTRRLPWVLAACWGISFLPAATAAEPPNGKAPQARLKVLPAGDRASLRQEMVALAEDAGLMSRDGQPPWRLVEGVEARARNKAAGPARVDRHPRFLSTERTETGAAVQVRLEADPDRRHGTSPGGLMMMFAPDPVQPGSSVAHWDPRATPDLLMEPFVRPGLSSSNPDLTLSLLEDIGWPRGSSHFVLIPIDPPEAGFEDARPFGGAPGNPATTLGEARLNVFHHVLGTWEGLLESDVDIDTVITWVPLFCEAGRGAALAGAGPLSAFAEYEGLPDPVLWFPAALAESLTGDDLTGPVTPTGGGDIQVIVNVSLDDGCLGPGTSWYYGLDGNEGPGQIDLAAVLLHELGHGLGMVNFSNPFTGELLLGRGSIYDRFLTDRDSGKGWLELDDAGRAASAISHGRLLWSGPKVTAAVSTFLDGGAPTLTVLGPPDLAGDIPVNAATFGPQLTAAGIELPLGCMVDGAADPSPLNGCTASLTAGALAGSVGLVDDGACSPVVKARQAQAAAAAAVLVANSAGGSQLIFRPLPDGPGVGEVAIPVLGLGTVDGRRLRQAACGATAGYVRDGRFQITATWQSRQASGVAAVTPLTADSSYLTFFNPANVELVVMVLDACSQDTNPSYWVFAAGLTDVEVALTVIDTATGLGRIYRNPLGHAFEPILDTHALPTCP